MKSLSFPVAVGCLFAVFCLASGQAPGCPQPRSANVDLDKFQGKWYEIARTQQFAVNSEKDLKCVFTEISWANQDKQEMNIHDCATNTSSNQQVCFDGRLRQQPGNQTGRLEASFDNWSSTHIRWVIGTLGEYSYALVYTCGPPYPSSGDQDQPSNKFQVTFWLLGRQRNPDVNYLMFNVVPPFLDIIRSNNLQKYTTGRNRFLPQNQTNCSES